MRSHKIEIVYPRYPRERVKVALCFNVKFLNIFLPTILGLKLKIRAA